MALRIMERLRSIRRINFRHILEDGQVSEFEEIHGVDDETGERLHTRSMTYRLTDCGCMVDSIRGICRCGATICADPAHSFFCQSAGQLVCTSCCPARGDEDSLICLSCNVRTGMRNAMRRIAGGIGNRLLPR